MAAIHDHSHNNRYAADRIRGATINLHRRWQKAVFFGGLFGAVLLIALPLLFPAH